MTEVNAGTALAVVGTVAADPMAVLKSRLLGGAGLGLITSLPMDTTEQKVAVMRLAKSEADNADKYIGKAIIIHDVVLHPVTVNAVDKVNGDVVPTPAVRAVLVLKGGKTLATVSDGIIKELEQLAAVFGPFGNAAWKEGVKVEFQQIKTRNGFRTYQLLPVL